MFPSIPFHKLMQPVLSTSPVTSMLLNPVITSQASCHPPISTFDKLASPLISEILSPLGFWDTALFWLFSYLTGFLPLSLAGSSSRLSIGVSWPSPLGLFSCLSILTLYLPSSNFVVLNIHTLMTPKFYVLVPASPLNSLLSFQPIGCLISISNFIFFFFNI